MKLCELFELEVDNVKMKKRLTTNKIKLHGFNNLTKVLSFNMYDICYTKTISDRNAYIEYIDEQYNAERLTNILEHVTEIIGANILNIAKQDYDPQGASVAILISEEPINFIPEVHTILAHLDKSHITVHTYPEYHPNGGVCTFRADIDVSTCGQISPLNALNCLIGSFDSDIITIDYRVRGFTRDISGIKIFNDLSLNSIQDYIDKSVIHKYQMIDVNMYQENIFHTKCKLKYFQLDDYLFGFSEEDIHPDEAKEITRQLCKEMDEIFYGQNMQ